MYLSYEDYAEMGGAAGAAAYPRLELLARQTIDRATHGRLRKEEPVRDAVRYCAFSLINAIAANEAMGGDSGRAIAAMSNDGVSVTFADAAQACGQAYAPGQLAILRQWLEGETDAQGVPLLYAGVDA